MSLLRCCGVVVAILGGAAGIFWLRPASALEREVVDPKTGEPQIVTTTAPNDFIGRWTLTTVTYPYSESAGRMVLDVVRCGEDFCGIVVSDKGECLKKTLTFKDNGPGKTIVEGDDLSVRYTGYLDWNDTVAKYYVSVDIFAPDSAAADHARHLAVMGYPASEGVRTAFDSRVYPITVDFKYVGAPACRAPSS